MKRILITGANSFVGTNIEKWLIREPEQFQVDTVDTMNEAWKKADFTKYDVVFHVAGIAHVNPKLEMAPLYYKVNRDLTIEIANWAKEHGVKQFIYMSSKIVYHASKSLPRLGWLAQKTPVFPAWHNKRSMLHVVNLAEFVKQITVREMSGTFFPQNAEYADTVEIVRLFAKEHGHKVWISRLFNPLVWLGAKFLPAIPKMFSDSYYVQEMSKMDFDYQVISFEESLKGLEIRKTMH